jgi:hypothetical protein
VASQRLVTIGVVLLLLGIQMRLVDKFVLNAETSQFIEQRLQRASASGLYTTQNTSLNAYSDPFNGDWTSDLPTLTSSSQKTVSPPRWLGLSLISVGAVLILTHPCYRS